MNPIRELRLRHSMKQIDLGKHLGVTFPTISKLEHGKILPGPELVAKLVNLFRCDPSIFTMPNETQMLEKRNKKTYINHRGTARTILTSEDYDAWSADLIGKADKDEAEVLKKFCSDLKTKMFEE